MIEQLANIARERHLEKQEYLFRQGETVGSLFLIKTGLVKAYYETVDGKHFIKSFIQEGGFIASMQAIVAEQSSTFTAVCLEACNVWEITRAQIMQLTDSDTGFVKLLNSLLLTVAAKKEQREYELLCLRPEKRYLALCEREPQLVKRVSQEDIARYLGITAVSLSRIRGRRRSSQKTPQDQNELS